MSRFAKMKEEHQTYGHGLWVVHPEMGGDCTQTARDNVCRDLNCPLIGTNPYERPKKQQNAIYNLEVCLKFKTKTEEQARYIMEMLNNLQALISCETSDYHADLIRPCAVCGVQITPNDVSVHHFRLDVDVHYLCSWKNVCGEDISNHAMMFRNGQRIPLMPPKED